MSDNDFLKKLIKSKREKDKSPLEKFVNRDDLEVDDKASTPQQDVEIEHYNNSIINKSESKSDVLTPTTENNSIKKGISSPPNEKNTNTPPDSLLKASGLREFDIDSLDVDSSEEVVSDKTSPANDTIESQNISPVTEDEINQLVGFIRSGNFDAAVDFIVQLKLKYNIDNIL